MLLAIAEDVRVVLIKIAERVVYLRSLTRADEALQRSAGRETLELFGPLANRLGVAEMKWELEDFSFRFTEPELYRKIAQLLDEKRNGREAYIQRVIAHLQEELAGMGIPATMPVIHCVVFVLQQRLGWDSKRLCSDPCLNSHTGRIFVFYKLRVISVRRSYER